MEFRLAILLVVLLPCAAAQDTPAPTTTPPQKLPPVQERVEVTATRLPEDPGKVPAAVEVLDRPVPCRSFGG
jgi:hypothetical protein